MMVGIRKSIIQIIVTIVRCTQVLAVQSVI